jgi:hypothetical protein
MGPNPLQRIYEDGQRVAQLDRLLEQLGDPVVAAMAEASAPA